MSAQPLPARVMAPLSALGCGVLLSTISVGQKVLLGIPHALFWRPATFLLPFGVGAAVGGALGAVWANRSASEAHYRLVAEFAAEMVFWRRADGTMRYVSPSAEAVTGHPPAAFLADAGLLEAIVHPDDRAALREHEERLRRCDAIDEIDLRIVRADGAIRRARQVCRCIRAPDGAPLAYRGSLTDVTAQRDLEERLAHAQRLEWLGQLAGGVAHDLRNVLAAVTAPAEHLRSSSGDPAARAAASDILLAADRATSLTRDLLDLARREPLALRPSALRDIVRSSRSLLVSVAGKGVHVQLEDDGDPLPVSADRARIEQVLMNLVANARDAMPAGGRVRVLVSREPATGGARLEVQDEGAGMDAETTRRIFEPFYTTKAPGKGTGLGLALVDRIVRDHHGAIDVRSAPGRGTTFRISLPLLPV